MSQKYPKSQQTRVDANPELVYVSLDGTAAEKKHAFAELNKAAEDFCAVERTSGSFYWDNYSNLDTNTSGRPGLMKSDYYKFRPGEAPPSMREIKKILMRADEAYHKVGLIRNVIDLMGDFACQGVRIVHPNKRIEKFFKNWFAKVSGPERSERFCNNLFRTGNIVIRKNTAKVTAKVEENLYRSVATPDMEVPITKIVNREIPFKYTFLEPSTIDVVGGSLSTFVGKPLYAITIPGNLRRLISAPQTQEERAIIDQLPTDILNAAKTNKPYLLPPDKTRVFHYKKDDWQTWAYPMIYSIFDDIAVLEKLRLADMAALDGAISNIRIFKLGNLEYKIAPSRGAAAKLAAILQNNVGGGTIDLIWGPDIELVESKTTVHQFLGKEKYVPHLEAIYSGLGVPPTLIGAGGTGTTNNYISLKTMVQRLQYARGILLSFWNQEVAEVQKAMGFRFPAKIEFDLDILDDESTVRSLLVQLVDRNIMSEELLQLRLGHDPDMETVRITREQNARENGSKVQKAGPYHDPQFGIALKKVALQTGAITPGQVGVIPNAQIFDMIMYDKQPGEKTALEMRVPPQVPGAKGPAAKPKGVSQQGRPKNSKDTTKRATKTFKPKTKASVEVWLRNAQGFISDTLNDIYLKTTSKKNMRILSNTEAKQLEKLKFGVLFNLDPMSKIDEESVCSALGKEIDGELYQIYQTWANGIMTDLDRPLTFDELKQVQITLYTETYMENDDG